MICINWDFYFLIFCIHFDLTRFVYRWSTAGSSTIGLPEKQLVDCQILLDVLTPTIVTAKTLIFNELANEATSVIVTDVAFLSAV
jgi:hypothetical protein